MLRRLDLLHPRFYHACTARTHDQTDLPEKKARQTDPCPCGSPEKRKGGIQEASWEHLRTATGNEKFPYSPDTGPAEFDAQRFERSTCFNHQGRAIDEKACLSQRSGGWKRRGEAAQQTRTKQTREIWSASCCPSSHLLSSSRPNVYAFLGIHPFVSCSSLFYLRLPFNTQFLHPKKKDQKSCRDRCQKLLIDLRRWFARRQFK